MYLNRDSNVGNVYTDIKVQQALVLFQINRKRSRFDKSLLKILDPSGQLTY